MMISWLFSTIHEQSMAFSYLHIHSYRPTAAVLLKGIHGQPHRFHGVPWISMENPWMTDRVHVVSMKFHGFPLKPMDDGWSPRHLYRNPWISMENPWTIHGFTLILKLRTLALTLFMANPQVPHGIHEFSMGFHEFPMGYSWDISMRASFGLLLM